MFQFLTYMEHGVNPQEYKWLIIKYYLIIICPNHPGIANSVFSREKWVYFPFQFETKKSDVCIAASYKNMSGHLNLSMRA